MVPSVHIKTLAATIIEAGHLRRRVSYSILVLAGV